MVRPLTTSQYPPLSTPGLTKAKEAAQKLKTTGPQVQPPATELRGLRDVLRDTLQEIETAGATEKRVQDEIRAYEKMKDGLKPIAEQAERDAKQFQTKKTTVRSSAINMQNNAPADRQPEFGEIVNRIDEVTVPSEATSSQKTLNDADKAVADARSELTRFFQAVKKEAKDCAQWRGWSQLQQQAEEARDGYAAALESAVSAYDGRVTKIREWVQHAERIITGEGPRQIEASRAARDTTRQREAERLVQQARDYKVAGEKETARLKEFQPVAGDLRKIVQTTREIRFDR
jgi:hypothetical protein